MRYKGVGLSKIARRRFFSRNNLLRNVGPLKTALSKKEKGSSIRARKNLSRWLE